MRIYVVGGPGSGKTSLASALSHHLNLPVLNLDAAWSRLIPQSRQEGWTWPSHAIPARDIMVAEYAAQTSWIIEGAHPPFLRALAAACDLVVWCDVSFRVAASRIVRRHVLADLARQNAYPGYARLFRFLRSVHRFYAGSHYTPADEWGKWSRQQIAEGTEHFGAKVLHLTAGSIDTLVGKVLLQLSVLR